jgi:long-chain acyl-CoA synthetase
VNANLALNLTASAARDGAAIAIKLDDVEINYALLAEGTARVAGMLHARGVRPGDRVAVMLPNVPHFPLAYYGALRAGAIVVPMNVLLKSREVAYYLSDSGAKVLFAWHGFAEDAHAGAHEAGAEVIDVVPGEFEQQLMATDGRHEVVERAGDDVAVLLYTSGTTGRSKGAALTHDNLRRNVEVSGNLFDMGPGAITLGALPLFHSFGQTCSLNATITAGGCLTMIPRFEPGKALEIMQRDGVTVFQGVPTMYSAILNHPGREAYDTSTLKVCVSGGAALPGEVMRGFEEAFGCPILEGYGLSETSPVASFNPPDRERKVGSIGIPIEGVEMKAVDDDDNEVPAGEVGEIVIRGHNVMKGYWEMPDATAEAVRGGWFHTGDMARVDEDGYFFIVDRKKDLIIRGGFNVYPREVEEVLYEHPAVREAAVIGFPDASLGEEIGAAVALKEGAEADAEVLKAHVKEQLAAYKYPRRIWFVDELPKGPTGKILKREIKVPAEVEAG